MMRVTTAQIITSFNHTFHHSSTQSGAFLLRQKMDIIQTVQHLESDSQSIAEAANEKKLITPRYGDSYKSAPLIIAETEQKAEQALAKVIDNNMMRGFTTEALLKAWVPTYNAYAKAEDTGQIWRYDLAISQWIASGEGDFEKAKQYTLGLLSTRDAPKNINIKITNVLNTNTLTPRILGTGQPGQTVTLKIGEITGNTVVDQQGVWGWTTPVLQDQTYIVTAQHTDTSGITSSNSKSFTINTKQGLFDKDKLINAAWVSATGVLSRATDPNNQWYNSQSFILPIELGKTYFFYFGSQNLNSPNNLALHGFDKIEDAVFVGNNINPVVASRITLTAVAGKTGWYQYTVTTTPETIKSIICTIKFTTMDLTSTLRIYKDALPQDA